MTEETDPRTVAACVERLTFTKVNRVAQICRDPVLVARNAESLRRACREWVDDGSERALKRIKPRKRKR